MQCSTPPPSPKIQVLKWTEQDFAEAGERQLPMGKVPDEWQFGDLDAGLKEAALVIDRTFVTPTSGHQPLEPRSAMAYWQNGKLYLHGGTQSTVFMGHAEHSGSRDARRRARRR